MLHLKEVNRFIENNRDITGIEFIDEIFDMLNFSFTISNKDIKRIPSEGRLICVSNHPVGSLDSLALLKAVSEIRSDVKIVANDVLMNITNLQNLFLPFDLETRSSQRKNIMSIGEALENEFAIIIFSGSGSIPVKLVSYSRRQMA